MDDRARILERGGRVVGAAAEPLQPQAVDDDEHRGERETEFLVLLQLGALGTVLLDGADDLLLLFAAFLLASVPF